MDDRDSNGDGAVGHSYAALSPTSVRAPLTYSDARLQALATGVLIVELGRRKAKMTLALVGLSACGAAVRVPSCRTPSCTYTAVPAFNTVVLSFVLSACAYLCQCLSRLGVWAQGASFIFLMKPWSAFDESPEGILVCLACIGPQCQDRSRALYYL